MLAAIRRASSRMSGFAASTLPSARRSKEKCGTRGGCETSGQTRGVDRASLSEYARMVAQDDLKTVAGFWLLFAAVFLVIVMVVVFLSGL
jgi:hypothetical protein